MKLCSDYLKGNPPFRTTHSYQLTHNTHYQNTLSIRPCLFTPTPSTPPIKGFIEDHDQNLKYLGLVGLVELMKSHPRSVVDHRELVLRCLTDDDITIRTRALELLAGIVSRKSLVDLVHHLLEHVKHSEGG